MDEPAEEVSVLCELCEPSGIDQPKGHFIEAIVDSGAVASVAKRGTFPGRVRSNAMSRAKRGYKSASKHTILNEGEQHVRFVSEEGHKCGLKIQVADVERPLISTADLTAAGNIVALEEKEGSIVNKKTGRKIVLPRKGNVYILRMWIPEGQTSGFTRQER